MRRNDPSPESRNTRRTSAPANSLSPSADRKNETTTRALSTRARQKEERRLALAAAREMEDAQYVRVYTGIDRPFLLLVMALLAFGIVMGFSAGYSYASYEYGDSMYFFRRHLIFAALGTVGMFLCLYIPLRGIHLLSIPAYCVAIALLVLVLIPGVGIREGDAQRWLYIPGVGTFQPSEIAKLAMVMMMAWYISKFYDKITVEGKKGHPFLWGFVGCCLVFGLIAGLVALEHHISGTLIIGAIGVCMMFVGRVRVRYLIAVGILLAVAGYFLIFVSGYGQTRVDIWKMVLFAPEEIPREIAQNQAYQNLQGLYAIGSGGLFGVGLGNSFQKYGFVSQPQNDFIFSIICEELGFIGAIGVMALFLAFAWRGYIIARNAPDLYSSLVVFGIVTQVTLQALLNICVVTAIIPNTGISLPFFSSGGTSLLIIMVEMGIVLSISRYSYQKRT